MGECILLKSGGGNGSSDVTATHLVQRQPGISLPERQPGRMVAK